MDFFIEKVKALGKQLNGNYSDQDKASGALWGLAANSENARTVLVKEGILKILIKLLSYGTHLSKTHASGVMWSMAHHSESARAIMGSEGAVKTLVYLLNLEGAKDNAAGALWSLAHNGENHRQVIAKEGGIRSLCQLLSSGTMTARQNAAGALWSMAATAELHRTLIVKEGVRPIIQLLASGSPTAKENCSGVLRSLALNSVEHQKLIIKEDGIVPLALLLPTGSENAAVTLKALANLSHQDVVIAIKKVNPDPSKFKNADAMKFISECKNLSLQPVKPPVSTPVSASTMPLSVHMDPIEAISDVGYKGVIKLLAGYAPPLACHEHMLQDLPLALAGVADIAFIVEQSQKVALSCIQRLPASVPKLEVNKAVAIASYTYDLGFNSNDDGKDNLYYILNNVLRQRDGQKMMKLKPYLFFLMSGLSDLPAGKY